MSGGRLACLKNGVRIPSVYPEIVSVVIPESAMPEGAIPQSTIPESGPVVPSKQTMLTASAKPSSGSCAPAFASSLKMEARESPGVRNSAAKTKRAMASRPIEYRRGTDDSEYCP
jgi:hypothetical protein